MVTASKVMKLSCHIDNTANKVSFNDNTGERPKRSFSQALSRVCSTYAVTVNPNSLFSRFVISGAGDSPMVQLVDKLSLFGMLW